MIELRSGVVGDENADENIDANGDVDEDAAGVAGTVGAS